MADLLEKIACPTLVAHNREARFTSPQIGQRMAAAIPAARFLMIEDLAYKRLAPIVDSFVSEDQAPARAEAIAFRTVLFTDLVGHTQMMSRLGDVRGREVLWEHERITREVLKAHGGTEVKTLGDGFTASFGWVTKAVECGIALQRAFAERDAGTPLSVRVGLNAGEPIEEEGDLFGADGEMAVCDWQIVLRARGPYDVAYFLSQSVNPADRRAIEMDILHRYHEKLLECGVAGYSFDQCFDDYRRSAMFCLVYPVVAGGNLDLANERGAELVTALLDRSVATILDLDCDETIPA